MFLRGAEINMELTVPAEARGLVILAYPCGSSRANPRHQHVAGVFNDARFATLFCDLLTAEEELLSDMTGEFRHDVQLLSRRLTAITDWCVCQPEIRDLPVAYLGVGAGAAAAFMSAAQRPNVVHAIVVRGGRLDLAWSSLGRVRAPVLLVAGEQDDALRQAYEVSLPHIAATEKQVLIVPRAGALFCEPTALDQFAEHAASWFTEHLPLDATEPTWGEEPYLDHRNPGNP
jgi:pimeloyl-ACP methyl ester carboxylesterase